MYKRLLILIVSLFACGIVYAVNDPMVSLFKFQSQMAKQGNVDAIMKLGEMYEEGQGTPLNLNKALEMFRQAEAVGSLDAAKAIRRVENKKKQILRKKEQDEANERAERERENGEKLAREQEAKEKLTREQTVKEKAARDRIRRENALKERAEKEKIARDELMRERVAEEKREKERVKQAQLMRERAVREEVARINAAKKRETEERAKLLEETNKDKDGFSSNPCNTPAARLMSTCK